MSVSLTEAARELGKSPETLRRWVREEGCPAIQGGRGRGKGHRVDLDAVRAWRDAQASQNDEAMLRQISQVTLDFYRRGQDPGEVGHRLVGVSNAAAAALLWSLLHYLAVRYKKPELRTAEMDLLEALVRQGFENSYGVTDSVQEIEQSNERDTRC